MNNALVIKDADGPATMLDIIRRAAADPNIDVDKMERLLAMQERVLMRNAEAEFNAAMSLAQGEMPRVQRDAKNPSTNSTYTRLETLNKEAVPIYTKHGFSLSFGTADCPVPGYFRITCIVSRGGYSRPYQCDLPLDDTGAKGNQSKTKMHGAGSTFSYGRRYLTLLIFNISLTNEDDDGNQGQRPKPAGPSNIAPTERTVKDLAEELWTALVTVRGPQHNWNAANQWLWKMEILDAGIPEAAPNLTPERFKVVIAAAKDKLRPA